MSAEYRTRKAFEEHERMLLSGDGDLFPPAECCYLCGNETGRAGRDEDSLYDDEGDGPYCEECWGMVIEE
jgi:hypothetical protein